MYHFTIFIIFGALGNTSRLTLQRLLSMLLLLADYITVTACFISGTPQVQIDKLQRVQNAAARLIFKQPKFSHITPPWCQLHWLPIKYYIEFKIFLLCFKAVHGMAPGYIC